MPAWVHLRNVTLRDPKGQRSHLQGQEPNGNMGPDSKIVKNFRMGTAEQGSQPRLPPGVGPRSRAREACSWGYSHGVSDTGHLNVCAFEIHHLVRNNTHPCHNPRNSPFFLIKPASLHEVCCSPEVW